MDTILETKKQHVSAYHWPSSGFILEFMLQECYTIIVLLTVITLPTISLLHNEDGKP